MNIPLLILFLALTLLHLAACAGGRQKARLATKPLLLPALAAFYWCSLPVGAAAPAVLAALLFGLLGDVLLMIPRPAAPQGKVDGLLLGGMGAFLLGHVCYIAAFLDGGAWGRAAWACAAAGAACLAALILILRALWAHMGPMRLPGTVYLLALVSMAFCALASGLALPLPWRLAGGPLFVISDYILARSILLGPKRYTDFWVMLTYAAAQLCLVLSFL